MADESISPTAGSTLPTDRRTPPKPEDAELHEKNLDPDSFMNSTVRIPLMTLYKVATVAMFLLTLVNLCGLIGLLCHRRRNRATTQPRPPTYPTMDERTSNGPTKATTWEDALSTRGLGGLGRLTPTPPPFPAPKDDLNV